VTLWLALVILVVVTGLAIVAMLVARRRAPEGSHFNDGDRAAGVFGVLATGYAVLLGFVVFLAFTSYDNARTGAETEARIVGQQVETAEFFPEPARTQITAELVCYARSVAGVQWDRMEAGKSEVLNPWSLKLLQTLRTVEPKTASEQAAYSKWLDERAAREDARSDRIHGAVGVIPLSLWIVLFLTAIVIFAFMLFFADSGEHAVVQAMLMGSVVLVIVSTLLLLQFLDHPFHKGLGGLRPVAMERTLHVIDVELGASGIKVQPPCDARGNPT
jgi:succinate dehydrogenase/fumarate reductase cytochrome b subunit